MSHQKESILSAIVLRAFIPLALILLIACPRDTFAQAAQQDHLVTSQLLDQQVQAVSHTRQQNIETLTSFFNTPIAERALRNAHVDAVQVRTAIPTLSDQELANLAARAADAQQKFAAGFLGSGLLTLIIILVAIIIIVAIVH